MTTQSEAERYEAQVLWMASSIHAWCAAHPEAVIQFQRPSAAMLAMTLASALDSGLVSVNDHTRQMFVDLDWLREVPGAPAPTPLMVEMALEFSTAPGEEADPSSGLTPNFMSAKYGVCAGLNGHVPDGGGEPLVANPKCRCFNPMAAMACPYGHMLECHFPLSCEEANCAHYQQAQECENDTPEIETNIDPMDPNP